MVGEGEMQEGEDGVDVGEENLRLAARLESADDARVGLEDALAQTVNVVDEVEVALFAMECISVKMEGEENGARRRTGSALMAPACCSTPIVVSRKGSNPGPTARATSPKQLRMGGLTLRCRTVLCRSARRTSMNPWQ